MKISKKYLQNVINEEIQKVLGEGKEHWTRDGSENVRSMSIKAPWAGNEVNLRVTVKYPDQTNWENREWIATFQHTSKKKKWAGAARHIATASGDDAWTGRSPKGPIEAITRAKKDYVDRYLNTKYVFNSQKERTERLIDIGLGLHVTKERPNLWSWMFGKG